MRHTLGGVAALLAAAYGVAVLWGVADVAWSIAPMFAEGRGLHASFAAGSRGVWLGLLFVAALPFAANVGANRGLARWARRSGGMDVRLHRVHSFLLLASLLILLVPLVLSLGLGVSVVAIAWMGLGLTVAFALGAQSIALSVMLMRFARTPR